jgi:hypothetical protein
VKHLKKKEKEAIIVEGGVLTSKNKEQILRPSSSVL